ncbi:4Fe-4S dicluster domain-containing protein [Chloroflexota bacterium]
MTNKKINKNNIVRLLIDWGKDYQVFVPSREGDVTSFKQWDESDTEFLVWYRNSSVSPKALFLPATEEIFRFCKDNNGYSVEPTLPDDKKRLIFAVHPCDANALSLLDKTFKDTFEDPYYLSRRQSTVLVGMTCTEPYDSCFCTSLDSSPSDTANVDLMLTDIDDEFLVAAVTDKGKELLVMTETLADATAEDENKAVKAGEKFHKQVTRKLDTAGIDNKLLAVFEDKDFWETQAAKCISCGVCTLLCPTCYCFDINDEQTKNCGARFRSWDSCSFSAYTRMPAENPRKGKWLRVRNRVCHKYEYYPMNFNVLACTGCGRCIRACPVNWDIIQVLENLTAVKLESK